MRPAFNKTSLLEKSLGSARRRAVLAEIKRSGGLPVREIADRLGLSYMGAKQHCLVLQKKGFVETRNEHVPSGRPRLIHRLTQKGQDLFAGNECALPLSLLRQARALYGPGAPGKLLYSHFQEQGTRYLEAVPQGAAFADRLRILAGLREAEGCMSTIDGDVLVEYHAPLAALFEEFPEAAALEEALIGRVLSAPVKREIHGVPPHQVVRFAAFRCGDTGA